LQRLVIHFKWYLNLAKLFSIKSIYILFSLILLSESSSAQSVRKAEYLLKSINIYKICKFIEWPESNKESDYFVISIIGDLPEGIKIEIPPDKLIAKKRVLVKHLTHVNQAEGSNVLFICESEKNNIKKILNFTKNIAVLTIGDTNGFAEMGVMINFYIKDELVNFEINDQAVLSSKLEFQSQLFKIGRRVQTIN